MKLTRLVATLLGVASVVSLGMTMRANRHPASSPAVTHTVRAVAPATTAPDAPATDPLTGASAAMVAALATQPGLQASVSLINLDTGKEYDAGSSDTAFTAASTAKLVAVFDYIHQVELGRATLTRQLGGVSAQENIRRMIVNSDNDAWARLNQYLTFRGEQAYLQSLGVGGVVQANNMQFTTPNMAKLLQLFYNGQLMSTVHQQLLYGYLANTTVKNLIQAAVPATATVYHKYGQLGGNLHDAAIVQYAGHNFVLVIYTNNPAGNNRYNDQVNLMHAVTAAVLRSMGVS